MNDSSSCAVNATSGAHVMTRSPGTSPGRTLPQADVGRDLRLCRAYCAPCRDEGRYPDAYRFPGDWSVIRDLPPARFDHASMTYVVASPAVLASRSRTPNAFR